MDFINITMYIVSNDIQHQDLKNGYTCNEIVMIEHLEL